VNEFLIYAVMLESFIVRYIQLVKMLVELKEVLSHKLKCLYVYEDYHSRIWMYRTRNYECFFHFFALEINKGIV
jgi:hypothetical protein